MVENCLKLGLVFTLLVASAIADKEPRQVTLEAWEVLHRTQLQKEHPGAVYEVVDVIDKPWSAQSSFLGGFRLEERTKWGNVCVEGFRDIEVIESAKQTRIGAELFWAENCCAGTPCPERKPIGWMLELTRRQGKDLLALYHPKYGFKANQRKVKRANLLKEDSHFNLDFSPQRDWMECPADFNAAGEARCTKSAGGEGFSYYWKKDSSGVYLTEFTSDHVE